MASQLPSKSVADYKIACICPMGKELAAMRGMLDEIHPNLPLRNLQNVYLFGRIGTHDVVIAVLPTIGNNKAASTANQLLNDFPAIRFALLVGIGGGIPSEKHDIRLGDVVVSKAVGPTAPVVQYDMGAAISGNGFRRIGSVRSPSRFLAANVEQLQAQHLVEGNQISQLISQMLVKYPKMQKGKYSYPDQENDNLFNTQYVHMGGASCGQCDKTHTVLRAERVDTEPEVHYGPIGSGNSVIKDSELRDRLADELGILCFEMEAAGLTDELDCLVIRGVSDYADSHKNDAWQPYAMATAAAYAKEFILSVPRTISEPTSVQTHDKEPCKPAFKLGLNTGSAPTIQIGSFVGREEQLSRMSDLLLPHQTPPRQRILILAGLGGIGKTQLALEYSRRYQLEYDAIFWLDATSNSTLEAGFATLATRLRSSNVPIEAYNDEAAESYVRAWLSQTNNTRWCLILDNHDDPQSYDITKFYPHVSQGSIIITSRSPEFLNGDVVLLTKLDSAADGIALLSRRSGRDELGNDRGAQELVRRLDGLPLALATAGSFLKQSLITCAEYLQEYNVNWKYMEKLSRSLPEYRNRTLYTTWNVSFRQIEQRDSAAANMLRMFAFLDKGDIFFELIADAKIKVKSGCDWLAEITSSRFRFETAMQTLGDYCLIEVNIRKRCYSVHSCVHDWLLNALNDPINESLYGTAFGCTAAWIKRNQYNNVLTLHRHPIALHNRIVSHAKRLDLPECRHLLQQQRVDNVIEIGLVFAVDKRDSVARRILTVALDIARRDFGPRHAYTINAMIYLGRIYLRLELLAEAKRLLSTALILLEEHSQTDPRGHVITMINLGKVYRMQGKLSEAEAQYEKASVELKRLFGQDKFLDIALSVDYGLLLVEQNKLEDGLRLLHQALADMRTHVGEDDDQTLELEGRLAGIYDSHDRAEAIELYVHVNLTYLKAFGASHQDTIAMLNNSQLAIAKHFSKQLAQSRAAALDLLIKLVDLIVVNANANPLGMNKLGKMLLRLNDLQNGQTAFDLGLRIMNGRISHVSTICDGCQCRFVHYNMGRFICTTCDDLDLCLNCFQKFEKKDLILDTCRDHSFYNANRSEPSDLATFPTSEDQAWEKMAPWLQELRTKYTVMVKDTLDARSIGAR